MDVLPPNLKAEVLEDAKAALEASYRYLEPVTDDPTGEATSEMLGLAGVDIPPEVCAAWTPEQRTEAELYAGAVHLVASDNDDVEVPDVPAHVAAAEAARKEARR